nr:16S rRNA (guanine(527)-N(7))-methyltransferase RsmG [uncultured Desulfobulbus sp.]
MARTNQELLQDGARALGLELESAAVGQLFAYFQELCKWRQRVNLIARETPEAQIIENHFLDSLTLLPLLSQPGTHLLDVGTGAGFPGLVLASALPETLFTLVEPRQKRVSFLRHVIRTLGLGNVEVVLDRIESHGDQWQGRFSHITSRAVADPTAFLPLIQPLMTPETRVILMLAHEASLAGVAGLAGWQVLAEHPCCLPFSKAPRLLAEVGLGGS